MVVVLDVLRHSSNQQTCVLTLDVAASKWDLAARRAVGDWRVVTAPMLSFASCSSQRRTPRRTKRACSSAGTSGVRFCSICDCSHGTLFTPGRCRPRLAAQARLCRSGADRTGDESFGMKEVVAPRCRQWTTSNSASRAVFRFFDQSTFECRHVWALSPAGRMWTSY